MLILTNSALDAHLHISTIVSFAACKFLQARTTVAFRFANSLTVSLPIPELAPVTMKTRPSRLFLFLHFPQAYSLDFLKIPAINTIGKIR